MAVVQLQDARSYLAFGIAFHAEKKPVAQVTEEQAEYLIDTGFFTDVTDAYPELDGPTQAELDMSAQMEKEHEEWKAAEKEKADKIEADKVAADKVAADKVVAKAAATTTKA